MFRILKNTVFSVAHWATQSFIYTHQYHWLAVLAAVLFSPVTLALALAWMCVLASPFVIGAYAAWLVFWAIEGFWLASASAVVAFLVVGEILQRTIEYVSIKVGRAGREWANSHPYKSWNPPYGTPYAPPMYDLD